MRILFISILFIFSLTVSEAKIDRALISTESLSKYHRHCQNSFEYPPISFGEIFKKKKGYFSNPIIRGDMADPSVIRINNTYYLTATSSEWAPFLPVFKSSDLINWEQTGHIFQKQPKWTSNSFWAPELYYHNNKIYCYYTARRKKDNISYIGVAVSDGLSMVFTDHGPIIEHGSESIDAFVFNDKGQLYISWKAYGLDKRPIEILASKLSNDGLKLEGKPFSLLKDVEGIGMEGQCHFKLGKYYYIIYAAHSCCGFASDYAVYAARSEKFDGPYEKDSGNPILYGGKNDFISIGHGTMVTTPDNRMFYICHAYVNGSRRFMGRQPVIQEMYVNDQGWISFKGGRIGKIESAAPFNSTVQQPIQNFHDKFNNDRLKVQWTWNYPYGHINYKLTNGNLSLSGKPKKEDFNGTALCVRAGTPDYNYETQTLGTSASFKGLTMYGDNENLIALGSEGNQIVVKRIEKNISQVLYSAPLTSQHRYFKIGVKDGCLLTFYHSTNGRKWKSVLNQPVDGSYLVRWDRVARPGLYHSGSAESPAIFSYFKLENLNLKNKKI